MTTLHGESGKSGESSTRQIEGAEAEKLAGPISRVDGLRDALQKIVWTTSQRAMLRVISKDVRGLIGIQAGRLITGARTTEGKTGTEALAEMLAVRQGMFAFLPESQQTADLDQALGLDIKLLLGWRKGDPLPHGLDESLLLLLNASEEVEPPAQLRGPDPAAALPLVPPDAPRSDEGPLPPVYTAWGEAPLSAPAASLAKLTPQARVLPGSPAVDLAVSSEEPPTGESNHSESQSVYAPPAEAYSTDNFSAAAAVQSEPVDAMASPPAESEYCRQALDSIASPDLSGQAALFSRQELDSIAAPRESSAAGGFDRSALESIPTPRATGGYEPARSGASQDQVFADIEKSMGFSPQAVAPKMDKMAESPSKLPPVSSSSSPAAVSRYSEDLNKLVKATGQQLMPSRQFLGVEAPPAAAHKMNLAERGVRGLLPTVIVSVGLLIAAIVFTNQMVSEGLVKQSYSLGMEFYKGGQKELARKKFDDIVKRKPQDGEGYFFRGLTSAELKDYDRAVEDYDAAIKLQPGHVASYTGRALAYIKLRDYRRAIADCDSALKLKKDYTDAYRLRAIALAKDGRFKEAIKDCDKIIASRPLKGMAEILAVRGFVNFKLGKVPEAMNDFQAAIKYAPRDGSCYANLAQCHYQLHDFGGCLKICDQALHWSPRHVGALLLRGRCFEQAGDLKKALADYNKAVYVDPSPETHRRRADLYLSLKNYAAAAADLEEVVRMSPGDRAARELLARASEHVKQTPRKELVIAQDKAESSLKVSGNSDELCEKGYRLLRSGSAQEAVAVLGGAVRANPQSVTARRYLAHALAQAGNNRGAVLQFQALSGLTSLLQADQLAFGKALVGAGNFARAIQIYAGMLSSNSADSAARVGLIKAYAGSGDRAQAVSACNEGVRNARSAQEAAIYRGLLKSVSEDKGSSGKAGAN